MTDKELKHLSRSELLEMLIAQMEENEKLKIDLEKAQEYQASIASFRACFKYGNRKRPTAGRLLLTVQVP